MLADRVRMGGRRTKVLLYDRGTGEENWEHFPNYSSTVGGGTFVEHVYNDTFLQVLINFPAYQTMAAGFYTVLNMTNYNYVHVEMEVVAEYSYPIDIWASELVYSLPDASVYESVEGEITMTLDIRDVIGEKYLVINLDVPGYTDPMELKIYKVWVE